MSSTIVPALSERILTSSLQQLVRRSRCGPPPSPMHILFEAPTSPIGGSDSVSSTPVPRAMKPQASLDSIISLQDEKTDDQRAYDELIYRLCRSLFKRAIQKSTEIKPAHPAQHFRSGSDDNMGFHSDWCPLRHLFDPKNFYATLKDTEDPPSPMICTSCRSAKSQLPQSVDAVPQWLADELTVTKLAGGNSNHVYRLEHDAFPDKSILLRVYGSSGESIDRVRDVLATVQMSRGGLCPAVLHSFRWGRVEEFMENVVTCTTTMLLMEPKLLRDVYVALKLMHSLPYNPFFPESINVAAHGEGAAAIEADTTDNGLTYYKNAVRSLAPALRDYVNRSLPPAEGAESGGEPSSSYYSTLLTEKAAEDAFPTSMERFVVRLLRLSQPYLQPSTRAEFTDCIIGEMLWLRQEINKRGTPLVFSHNDLNPGNILLARRKVPARYLSSDVVAANAEGNAAADEESEAIDAESTELRARRFRSTRVITKGGQSKNLVDRRGILLIDFEYTDVNYRCFDLGNTICEMDYDYMQSDESDAGFIKYLYVYPPDETFKSRWLSKPRHYPRMPELIYDAFVSQKQPETCLGAGFSEPSSLGMSILNAISAYLQTIPKESAPPSSATQTEMSVDEPQQVPSSGSVAPERCSVPQVDQNIIVEVLLGMLASHLSWSLWSIPFGCNPDECTNCLDLSEFAVGSSGLNYILYGDTRLKEYFALKAWLLEKKLL